MSRILPVTTGDLAALLTRLADVPVDLVIATLGAGMSRTCLVELPERMDAAYTVRLIGGDDAREQYVDVWPRAGYPWELWDEQGGVWTVVHHQYDEGGDEQ